MPPTTRKLLYVDVNGFYREHSESLDSIKAVSFLTSGHELTDELLGKLVDNADVWMLQTTYDVDDDGVVDDSKSTQGILGIPVDNEDIGDEKFLVYSSSDTIVYRFPQSSDVRIPLVGTPTYSTLKNWMDEFCSSGYFAGGEITDDTEGGIDVAQIEGWIKSSDSEIGEIKYYTIAPCNIASASLNDNDINFIYVDYNSGTPIVRATNDRTVIKTTNQHQLGRVFKIGTDIDIVQTGVRLQNFIRNEHERVMARGLMERMSGSVIAEKATRRVTCTEGVWYIDLSKLTLSPFDSSAANFEHYYYLLNGVWTDLAPTGQIDNTQYNNVGTPGSELLSDLSGNNYGVHWIYQCVAGELNVIFGTGSYASVSAAHAAQPPSSIPLYIESFGVLIGKIIIKKSASVFTAIENSYDTLFIPVTVTTHNNLGGLQGGTADEYYHLTNTEHGYLNQSVTSTASPTFKMLTLDDTGTAEELILSIKSKASSAASVYFYDGATLKWKLFKDTDNTFILYNSAATANALKFDTSSNATFAGTIFCPTFDTNVAAAGVTLSGTTLAADGTDANIDINITPKGTGSVVVPTVKLKDTNASNTLQIKWNENDTADRIINLLLNGADRSFTIEADSKINQDLTSDSTVAAFGTLTLGTLKVNILDSNVRIVGPNSTYTTIPLAIAAANAGDAIIVLPGTYGKFTTENKDNLRIVASGGKYATIITEVADTLVDFGTSSGCFVEGFNINITAVDGAADYCITGANDSATDYNIIKDCDIYWTSADAALNNHRAVYLTNGCWKFVDCNMFVTTIYSGASANAGNVAYFNVATDALEFIGCKFSYTSALNAKTDIIAVYNVNSATQKYRDCEFIVSSASDATVNTKGWQGGTVANTSYFDNCRFDIQSSGASSCYGIVSAIAANIVYSYGNSFHCKSTTTGSAAYIEAGSYWYSFRDRILAVGNETPCDLTNVSATAFFRGDAAICESYPGADCGLPDQTIYVGVGGNDSTGTGLVGAPFLTFAKALSMFPRFVPPNVIYWLKIVSDLGYTEQLLIPPTFYGGGQIIIKDDGGTAANTKITCDQALKVSDCDCVVALALVTLYLSTNDWVAAYITNSKFVGISSCDISDNDNTGTFGIQAYNSRVSCINIGCGSGKKLVNAGYYGNGSLVSFDDYTSFSGAIGTKTEDAIVFNANVVI